MREDKYFLSPAAAAAWLGLCGISVMGILPWAHIKFPIVDLGEMVFQVRRVQLGYVPYRDTFTHHFLGYFVPFYALGSVLSLTPTVLKVTSLFFNMATAIAVFLALRDLADSKIAWLGAFLTVTLGWFWSWQGFGFTVQSYFAPILAAMILCAVRACLFSRRTSLYCALFCCGALIAFDQRTAVFLVAPGLIFACDNRLRNWHVALVGVACLLVVPASGAWYLWRSGAWGDFIEQTIVFPLLYRNHGVPVLFGRIISTWFGSWIGGERIAVPAMLAGLIAAALAEKRKSLRALLLTTTGCAALYALLGGRPYGYYFMVFGPIALILISLLPKYVAAGWTAGGKPVFLGVAGLGILCALRPIILFLGTGSFFLAPNEATIEAVAGYLRANTSVTDGVLVWGYAPEIYVLGDRFHTFKDADLLSIGGGNFASSQEAEQGRLPHMVREFNDYLTITPPKVIAVYSVTHEPCPGKGEIERNLDYLHAPQLRPLRDALSDQYRSELEIEGPCDRAQVFVRKDPIPR